jgi:hypothetical protein
MDKEDSAVIYQQRIETAARLAAEQLHQAYRVVREHQHELDEATRHVMVAAVLQAMAVNFHALRGS